MRALQIAIVLLLSLWWMPATSYCVLERAGIVQCSDCCTDSTNDCSETTCGVGCNTPASTVPKAPVSVEKVTLTFVPGSDLLQQQIALAGHVSPTRRIQSPPDCLELLEFLGRTATPARAPSFA